MSEKILKRKDFTSALEYDTLGKILYESTEKYKNRICQIDAGYDKTESFLSVRIRSIRLAIAMKQQNLKSPDVALICSSNTLDNCIPILASLYLSVRVANLDPRLSLQTTEYLISLIKPKIIFVEESSVQLIENSLNNLQLNLGVIVVIGQSKQYRCLQNLIDSYSQESDTFKPVNDDADDIALICFSSGTSSLPKPICHSHKTFTKMLEIQGFNTKHYHKNNNVYLQLTTFYWFSGIALMLFCIMEGGTRVFAKDTSANFTLKLIEKYKLTELNIIPSFSYQLTKIDSLENYDISSLKKITVNGGTWTWKGFHNLQNLFKNSEIFYSYGMTEVGGISKFHVNNCNLQNKKCVPCGKLFFGTSLKIVDVSSGKMLGHNQKGEIYVKTPSLMLGYYNADASSCFDSDGFLKTGDLGYFDENECLYVIERCKDMFRYINWHVLPTPIENALMEHPDVEEAAVFGLPKEEIGEAPAACVILKPNCNTTITEINEFVSAIVSEGEKLRGGIFIVDSLPKTSSGKIQRYQVRENILKLISTNQLSLK